MNYLDYEPKQPRKALSVELSKGFMIAPGLLMAFAGISCVLPALMPFDSPPKNVNNMMLTIWRWMCAFTSPVGIASLVASYRLGQSRGEKWLWLNWVVFAVYATIFSVIEFYSTY